MEKINWCFKIKNGLKLIEPNTNVSNSYLKFAEKTLSKINLLLDEKDYLWASVRIYYCAYYSISSFLQAIGVKSENHECSIELVKFLLEDSFVKDIEIFKKGRIESQYYLNVEQGEKLMENYKKVKDFYLKFKEEIDSLDKRKISSFRRKLKEIIKNKI